MLELRLIILYLPTILLATKLEPDHNFRTNSNWQEMWKETNHIKARSIDSSVLDGNDNSLLDDSDVGETQPYSTSTLNAQRLPHQRQHQPHIRSRKDGPMNLVLQNTTVQLGGTAFLVCKVPGVDRVGVNWNQISWVRKRDWHILSSGSQMYTNDERFAILHATGSNIWTLQIKFVQHRDHGVYECQVSTSTGIIAHLVNLQVVVPEAFILGSSELHVDMGSVINLVCIIEKSPQPPQYVYWQRNDRMINYDDSRRDITIETSPGPRTQSRLIIREPQMNDSGNYTCSASNTEPASIYVFVSKGDNTAAISRRNTSSVSHKMTKLDFIFIFCVIFTFLSNRSRS